MYHQFNVHKSHVLPTQLYLCVLCGSENKQRLFPYTALTGWFVKPRFNSLKLSGHYMYHQFNVHKSHVLPTQLYLCVLCVSENKQRLFPYTALTDLFV